VTDTKPIRRSRTALCGAGRGGGDGFAGDGRPATSLGVAMDCRRLIATALPGFRRLARPILLSPGQGADTIVWLATTPPEKLGSGRFWHDRRPRPEYLLPWTREKDPAAARTLWDQLDPITATGAPTLAYSSGIS
jgi:hypothetical protein